MFQNMGLHVIKNPANSFSYVGSIPASLGEKHEPTTADIMAGRCIVDEDSTYVVKFPTFDTRQRAIQHANNHGYCVCAN